MPSGSNFKLGGDGELPTEQAERTAKAEQRLDHIEKDVAAIKSDVRQLRDALLINDGKWTTAKALIGLGVSLILSIVGAWVLYWLGPRNGGP